MDRYNLPTSVIIGDTECEFNTDFRDILQIFKILNDPDLLKPEKIQLALEWFYKDENYYADIEYAVKYMFDFMSQDENDNIKEDEHSSLPLYDWEQDFNIIVAPINRVMGKDIRGLSYLHWWTFLSAFMEIGECTFNTFVGIRSKMNKGIKLEKYEEKIYRDNKDKIVLKKKYDFTTQSILDEILGKE